MAIQVLNYQYIKRLGYVLADMAGIPANPFILLMEKSMNTESERIYEELSKEVTWINYKWAFYYALYESKESRIDLINEADPVFFDTIQILLLESVILNIARLFDPASMGKNENLTLDSLEISLDIPSCSTINILLDEAKISTEKIRIIRHKYIAHLDIDKALKQSNMLDEVTKDEIEKAINNIVSVMKSIGTHYFDTMYDYSGDNGQINVESILFCIKNGIQYEKEILNRRKNATTYEEAELKPDEI
jgi:hypothetical protein